MINEKEEPKEEEENKENIGEQDEQDGGNLLYNYYLIIKFKYVGFIMVLCL